LPRSAQFYVPGRANLEEIKEIIIVLSFDRAKALREHCEKLLKRGGGSLLHNNRTGYFTVSDEQTALKLL
jgi:ribosomal protein L17